MEPCGEGFYVCVVTFLSIQIPDSSWEPVNQLMNLHNNPQGGLDLGFSTKSLLL